MVFPSIGLGVALVIAPMISFESEISLSDSPVYTGVPVGGTSSPRSLRPASIFAGWPRFCVLATIS